MLVRVWRREYAPGGVLAVLAAGVMVYAAATLGHRVLLQVLMNGAVLGLTYLLVALGLALMWGIMHLMNFAQGQFFMLGSFMAWYFMIRLGFIPDLLGRPWDYFFAAFMALLITGALGVVVERFLFRRFGQDLLPALIISMAISMLLATGMLIAFGLLPKSIPTVFGGLVRPLGAVITNERIALVAIALVLISLLYLLVTYTKIGKGMRAIRDDEDAAALQGINIGRYRSGVMFLGCALAGAAGVLYGPLYTVHPFMGEVPFAKALAIIVLGGLGSLPGTAIAAFFLGVMESFGATLLGSQVADMFGFAIIMLVLIFRPAGLMGRAE